VIVDGNEPIGACALEDMDEVERIVDLVAVPERWHACLRAIAAGCAGRSQARHVEIKLFASYGERAQLWRAGFAMRERKPFLCMVPQSGSDERFLDPARWYYTLADSDLDDHR
jgi:hypothetical protein